MTKSIKKASKQKINFVFSRKKRFGFFSRKKQKKSRVFFYKTVVNIYLIKEILKWNYLQRQDENYETLLMILKQLGYHR